MRRCPTPLTRTFGTPRAWTSHGVRVGIELEARRTGTVSRLGPPSLMFLTSIYAIPHTSDSDLGLSLYMQHLVLRAQPFIWNTKKKAQLSISMRADVGDTDQKQLQQNVNDI